MQLDVVRGDARDAWELAVGVVVGDAEAAVGVLVRGALDDGAEPEHEVLPRAHRPDPRAHAHLRSLSDALALCRR